MKDEIINTVVDMNKYRKKILKDLPEPNPKISRSRVQTNDGIILKTRKLTNDTIEVVVKCDVKNTIPISGAAGQYAALKIDVLNRPRSFSFAKNPENENIGEHTFFVKYVKGGKFSKWLFEKDRTGDPITLIGPLGKFELDKSEDSILCIAGGSGLSVIKAILEHAADLSVARDVLFLYGAKTQSDLYCLDEIDSIKKKWNKNNKFECVNILSNEPSDSGWQGPTGFVTDYLKHEYIDNNKFEIKSSRIYMCGPPPMIDLGVKIIINENVDPERIYFDKFEDATSPAPVIDNSKCVLCDECLLVKPTDNCIVEASGFHFDGNNEIFGYEKVSPAHTSGLYYNSLFINEKECIRCMACVDKCPTGAISQSNVVKYDLLRDMKIHLV